MSQSILSTIVGLVLPKGATLTEQREILPRLEEALANAQTELQRSRDAFDLDGSPAARKALETAKEAERTALDYLERAQRNLGSAEAEHTAADRKAKERRAAEIRALLADRSEDTRLEVAEVEAWLGVVRARLARRDRNLKRAELDRELAGIRHTLGDEGALANLWAEVDPHIAPIVEALDLQRVEERDETRKRYIGSAANAARSFR